MIFSLKHKFIFIRNPSCASRSISQALEPFGFDIQNYLGKKGFGYKHCTYKKQKTSDELNVSEMFGDKHIPGHNGGYNLAGGDFFVFAGVRNPWERAYSLFEGQRIMNVVENNFDRDLDLQVTDWNANQNSINENMANLTDGARLMLNQKDYRVGVNFVYRFEKLEEDFEYICEKLKINARLPPKEKTYSGVDFKEETYRDHFNKKSIDMIAEINNDDIKEYGYEF